MWIITASVLVSTLLLMSSAHRMVLLTAVVLLGLIVPCWKYVVQSQKRLLRGPWDIPSVASMRLDYGNRLAEKDD